MMNRHLFVIVGMFKEIGSIYRLRTVAMIKEGESVDYLTHDLDRDVLGARACIRCHGYIERSPVLVISAFESVVRCVNCGRLYRWVNSHFERYPPRKKEWDDIENKNRNGNGHGK